MSSSLWTPNMAQTSLSATESTKLTQKPLTGTELMMSQDSVFDQSFTSQNFRQGNGATREGQELMSGVRNLFNGYENTKTTCATASVAGGRTSGPNYTNSGAQCFSAVSIKNMAQKPSAAALIQWDTESRQGAAKFTERMSMMAGRPSDGSYAMRLEGAPQDAVLTHEQALLGTAQCGTYGLDNTYCDILGALALPPNINEPDFFSDVLVTAQDRAVVGGRGAMNGSCVEANNGATNMTMCGV